MTTFSLLFSSPFSWLPCAISPPCKFASLALKRPYFLWARSSTPKILRYGCCNVNQKMHISNLSHQRAIPVLFRHSATLGLFLSLRCAARRASGRKEVSAFTRTHRYGFAYARLHSGLTVVAPMALGAWLDWKCVAGKRDFICYEMRYRRSSLRSE